MVYLHRNESLRQTLGDARILLKESARTPTRCRELVMDHPDFIGVKDASGQGVGGIIVGERKECRPTVFRVRWPADVTRQLISWNNPGGTLTNSDLEIAGLFFLWLAMETVCEGLREAHVALFSNNSPTVGWVRRMATKGSLVAAALLRALSLRMKTTKTSPLAPLHIPGDQNAMTDIPSRSWGSKPKWHFKTDEELLTFFNEHFPLPNQNSWTVFRHSSRICTRVISILRMQHTTLEEWRRLPPTGKSSGGVGKPTANLWEWTLHYRTKSTPIGPPHSEASQQGCERDTMATDAKSELARYLAQSRPLARRSQWPVLHGIPSC